MLSRDKVVEKISAWLTDVYGRDGSINAGSYSCVVTSAKNRRRVDNQDRAVVSVGRDASGTKVACLIVADGVGGAANGGAAASCAISEFIYAVYSSCIKNELEMKNMVSIIGECVLSRTGGASTLAALIVRDGMINCVWVGDSRVYRILGEAVEKITRDDNVGEYLLGSLFLSKNALVKFLGQEGGVDANVLNFSNAGKFLIMTDGAYTPVECMIDKFDYANIDGQKVLKSINMVSDVCGGMDNCTAIYYDAGNCVFEDPGEDAVVMWSHRDKVTFYNMFFHARDGSPKKRNVKKKGKKNSVKEAPLVDITVE